MKQEYEVSYALIEASHPWFVARRALFSELAALAGLERTSRILDVGCGTGMLLLHLQGLGYQDLAGVEVSRRLRQKFRVDSIPLHAALPDATFDATFDAIFLLDVLEHIADDEGTLAHLHRLLRPGGTFLMSVPAHPSLWGPHDEHNQHQRRYRRRELREKLTAAGFELQRFSYWNMFCYPIACGVRWLGIGKQEAAGDIGLGPAWALKIYGWVLALENWLLRRCNLPIGISLIATARRARAKEEPRGDDGNASNASDRGGGTVAR